jgi:hypothetical protein
MPQNNIDQSSTGDAEFNNLCSHYKDTYEIHLSSTKQRDTLFYILLVIVASFSLRIGSVDLVNGVLSSYINKSYGVAVDSNTNLFGTMLWLLLFGVSSRYYQIVVQIERQYAYIHHLEELLNEKYAGSQAFTREGKSYLDKYPLFSNWICFLYTGAFPALIFMTISFGMQRELTKSNLSSSSVATDLACYLITCISTILYVGKIHSTLLAKLLAIPSSFRRRGGL